MGDWEVKPRPEWQHNLPHNKREWSPQRCIFFDTETGEEKNQRGAFLPLRSWEVCVVWRDKPEGHPKRERWYNGETGLELTKLLDELVTTDKTTWLWAHNLGFDLSTTRLPEHLPRMGWHWTMGVVTGETPWMRWKKENRSLTAVDSWSHLPKKLAAIGDAIGLPKLQMPAFDASPEAWAEYRHRDVLILRHAVLSYLEWWDASRLGNLSVTGPASGWNCWRHTADNLKVRIEGDPDVRAWGRAAIYGGRRSTWRVGDLTDGPYVEIDVQRAHLNIMRNETTPIGIYGWINDLNIDHKLLDSDRAGVLADCVVRTETPRYPLATKAGVLYPVGEFKTRLAGPELALAKRRGDLVSIGRGLAVALGRPMGQWADWVESGLSGGLRGLPAVAEIAFKGWSRTVIGKWAGRTSREVTRAPWPDDGWRVETGYYNSPDVSATTVYGSGEARTYIRDQEAYDSFPAAYAWITSHMRVVLGRLLDAIDSDYLVACNTDSIVVHWDGLRQFAEGAVPFGSVPITVAVERMSELMSPYTVTVKHIENSVRVKTPEHLVFGAGETQSRKVASVPGNAKETKPWVFRGDTWPGLVQQLSMTNNEGYQLLDRTIDVSRAKPLAWLDSEGNVFPPRYRVSAHGDTEMVEVVDLASELGTQIMENEQHPEMLALLAK